MLTDPNTDVTPPRPWWERALDTAIDRIEYHVLDPMDAFARPKIEHYRAAHAHHLVSTARRTAEHRAVADWMQPREQRVRMLHAWTNLEAAASRTRARLHAHHGGPAVMDHSNGCCAALTRLYLDRADVIHTLAVVEEQTDRHRGGRSPNFGAVSGPIRRTAPDLLVELVETPYRPMRAEVATRLADQLAGTHGAAVHPIHRFYIG